MIQNKILQ